MRKVTTASYQLTVRVTVGLMSCVQGLLFDPAFLHVPVLWSLPFLKDINILVPGCTAPGQRSVWMGFPGCDSPLLPVEVPQ